MTVSQNELDDILDKLDKQTRAIFTRLESMRANAGKQQAPNNQQSQAEASLRAPTQFQAQPHNQSHPQKLTAESLKHHEAELQKSRAASLQKNQDSNKPPAAPTDAQPPFGLGQQSPQGIPNYGQEVQNRLTREQLVLPNKRRKQNQTSAATTPAQTAQTPGQHTSPPKSESPVMQRTPAPPKMKCAVEKCDSKALFDTQEDLDKHISEAHPAKEEEIKDPLEFCLESMRIVLNLDDNGKAKPVPVPAGPQTASATAMKKSASSSSQPGILKRENSSTPMSRNPTGPSPPTLNHLRTPQPSGQNVRTPQSDTPKAPNKAAPSPLSKVAVAAPAEPDPWANARVPQSWFSTVLGGASDPNRAVSADFLTEWINRNSNAFTINSSPSGSAGAETNAPAVHSDISTGDDLDIEVGGEEEGWADLAEELEEFMGDGCVQVDPLLDMDWETAFGAESAEGGMAAGVGNAAMGGMGGARNPQLVKDRRGNMVSEEFMRVYQQEEYTALQVREREKRDRMTARK